MPIPGLGTIVVGAVTTGVTTFFQLSSAKIKARREHRISELKKAEEIFGKLSVSMDTLAFLSTEAMFGLVFRYQSGTYTLEDQKVWDAYLEALNQWKRNKTKNIAETAKYFGLDACGQLKEIQENLQILERQLAAIHFKRKESKHYVVNKRGDKNDFRTKYFRVRGPLDEKLIRLSQEMLGMIQREEVGVLKIR